MVFTYGFMGYCTSCHKPLLENEYYTEDMMLGECYHPDCAPNELQD